MFTFEIDASDLERGFEGLADDIDRETTLSMQLSSDLLAAEAKRRAPRGTTSILAESVQPLPTKGSFTGGSLEGGAVALAPYALFVERGTRPHLIIPRVRRALRFPIGGGFVFSK